MTSTLRSYSAYWGQTSGTTGTGLDQTIGWIARDPGLAGNVEASAIAFGGAARARDAPRGGAKVGVPRAGEFLGRGQVLEQLGLPRLLTAR